MLTMTHKFEHREGTQDRPAFEEVVLQNCYHLPHFLSRDDIIIDGGAHIGSFTVACAGRGAGTIYAFEPDPANYRMLVKNTHGLLGVHTERKALWRSDKTEQLYFSGYTPRATACGTVMHDCTVGGQNQHIPVESVALDEVILKATDHGKRSIRLLKLDIEAAEFVVLGTSQCLHLVQEIVGEAHDLEGYPEKCKVPVFKNYDHEELCEFLGDNGFNVTFKTEPSYPKQGVFVARRA